MEATLLPPSTSSISKPGRRMRPCGRSGKECWPNTRLARPVGRLRQVSPSRHLCSVPLNYYPLAGATQGPVLPYVFPEQPLETEAQRKAALARQAGGGAKKKKKKQASRAKADRKGKGKARAFDEHWSRPITTTPCAGETETEGEDSVSTVTLHSVLFRREPLSIATKPPYCKDHPLIPLTTNPPPSFHRMDRAHPLSTIPTARDCSCGLWDTMEPLSCVQAS